MRTGFTSKKLRYFSALKMKKFNQAAEPALYTATLLLHLIPILVLTPFLTLDGPAHLYNAELMKELLKGQELVIGKFFDFNKFPHPNWSGHLILMCLLYILPPLLAEKFFLCLIVLISALGFRKLVKTIEPSAVWMSWLFFPFLLNFAFLMGFYNFSFALGLLPWWLALWIRQHDKEKSIKMATLIFLFLLVLYFSHLVIFLLAGLFAGSISLFDSSSQNKKKLKGNLLFLLFCSLPGLLLTFFFLISTGTDGYRGEISRLPVMQLLNDILFSRMFIVYDYATEKKLSIAFTVLMLFLSGASIFHRTIHRLQKTFLIIFLTSLAIIFILPDSMASGGILSVRLVQWFYIAWCLLLITFRIPLKIQKTAALLAVLFSIGMLKVHWSVQVELNKQARTYLSVNEHLQSNTVVLPINYSTNWLHSNLSCYLGAINKVVVLDNYEATHDLFPLLWKKNMDPEIHMGNHVSSAHPCVRIAASERHTGIAVDYVCVWEYSDKNNDSCDIDLMNQLQNDYHLAAGNIGDYVLLYSKNKKY